MKQSPQARCPWSKAHPLLTEYHDDEWGCALHDDTRLFESLVLEGMQAGLSWLTVLKKRENFKKAFDSFDPRQVAQYGEEKIAKLLCDEGIIRNNLKIRSAVNNARRFLEVQDEFGSFDDYIWGFVDGPVVNRWESENEIPARTPLSDAISKDMKKRGFSFVGSTIIYAYMQAIGMVDDHLNLCFRKQ